MKIWAKRIGWALAGLAILVIFVSSCFIIYAQFAYRKTWDLPLPATRAVSDSSVIARGRYLVYGPAHCADCHAPDSVRERMFRGEEIPLTGGPGEHTFLGSWTAPNLTPDSATGLGALGDGQLARMFRHGVNREGRLALPFTDAYADLAENDLAAILSFLRALPRQSGVAPSHRINLLGKITLAYFLKPYAPAGPPPENLPPELSPEYGSYLANTVGRCQTCHTARNLKTGDYLGAPFAGGLPFKSRLKPGYVYVSPNLTPDSTTGRITKWSEDDFLRRFRAGLLIPDSPMPWGSYVRMTDDDIRALYRYLHSLPPARRDNGPILQSMKGKTAAG